MHGLATWEINKQNEIMEKEELRNMLINVVDEEHHQDVEKWLDKTEKQFERIANATNWPIGEIRGFYRFIGITMGLKEGNECSEKLEE